MHEKAATLQKQSRPLFAFCGNGETSSRLKKQRREETCNIFVAGVFASERPAVTAHLEVPRERCLAVRRRVFTSRQLGLRAGGAPARHGVSLTDPAGPMGSRTWDHAAHGPFLRLHSSALPLPSRLPKRRPAKSHPVNTSSGRLCSCNRNEVCGALCCPGGRF